MHRTITALLLTATASAALATGAAPANAAAAKCGTHKHAGQYMNSITGLKNISCKNARNVALPAYTKGGDVMLCKKKSTYKGWTIRHTGGGFALKAKFSKGSQSFTYASQGAC